MINYFIIFYIHNKMYIDKYKIYYLSKKNYLKNLYLHASESICTSAKFFLVTIQINYVFHYLLVRKTRN